MVKENQTTRKWFFWGGHRTPALANRLLAVRCFNLLLYIYILIR